jgi:hypothetical protein
VLYGIKRLKETVAVDDKEESQGKFCSISFGARGSVVGWGTTGRKVAGSRPDEVFEIFKFT